MGAQLVGLVFALHPMLPPPQKLVLVRMAHMALDNASEKHEAATYFGGWELLAEQALGYRLPAPGDKTPEARRVRATSQRAVQRALEPQIEAGIVVRLGRQGEELKPGESYSHTGHRQDYRLHLFPRLGDT